MINGYKPLFQFITGGILVYSAYLASAAAMPPLQNGILANSCFTTSDPAVNDALVIWKTLSRVDEPVAPGKVCDNIVTSEIYEDLMISRLKAASAAHAGDWLNTGQISSLGLSLLDEAIRVAVGHHLGSNLFYLHTCVYGTQNDARGLHGFGCKKSEPRHICHAMLNDIIWRAIKKTQVPDSKEPVGLSRVDAKSPDGATLIPWAHGKLIAWDVTVPDMYAQSHLDSTSLQAGAAFAKKIKYMDITNTNIFIPVAIKMANLGMLKPLN